MTHDASQRRRGRRVLAGLAAIFFLPLAVSFFLYYGTEWRPGGRVHHGDLVDPAVPLPAVSVTLADGRPAGPDFLRRDWHLVYVGEGACGADCRDTLRMTRQVRLALDKDLTRVVRVFLYTGTLGAGGSLRAEHPDLLAASADGPGGATLLAALRAVPPRGAAGRLYIVDPLGNLVMGYAPDTPPRALLEDLERLLRLSHIG